MQNRGNTHFILLKVSIQTAAKEKCGIIKYSGLSKRKFVPGVLYRILK